VISRKKLIAAFGIACLTWFVIGLGCDIASVVSDHYAMKVGLPAPNSATSRTVPLKVCHFHGPCLTVYVTQSYELAERIESEIAISFLISMGLLLIPTSIAGYRSKKRKAAQPYQG
jgi:hypothetical protein